MNCQETRLQLDDLLDGELSASDRSHVEDHLTRCAACRAELAEIESLTREARQLPSQIAPPRDLWPEIESRLRRDPSADRSWWLQAAAAVIALVAISMAMSMWSSGRRSEPEAASQEPQPTPRFVTAQAELARAEDGVLLARTDLVTAIESRRDVVEPDTLLVMEESMILLDRAIGEIRAALQDDPQNLQLRMLLAARYQQERKLLQKVSRV
jgi:anti-sigma factor RsiW